MKYFFIAGESSGDMHGANLITALRAVDENCVFAGCGGDKMINAGCEIMLHISSMDFMGFTEVIKHLPQIFENFKIVENAIKAFKPDVVIFIDYPGFNLRMLKKLKTINAKMVYYIPPQLWAWKKRRIKVLKQFCDKTLVILPFEEKFYLDNGLNTTYVGHPLLDEINSSVQHSELSESNRTIALLPGSRKQEINKMLPIYLGVARVMSDVRFVIGGLSRLGDKYYKSFNLPRNVTIEYDNTYKLLSNVNFAVVTSGTATLETALFNVPQVVCYKLSWLSYQIGKRVAKVKYISLVNLILDKAAVKELIQSSCTEESIKKEINSFFNSKKIQDRLIQNYSDLQKKLGGGGASVKAAKEIYALGNSI